jgi:hypothetical protein
MGTIGLGGLKKDMASLRTFVTPMRVRKMKKSWSLKGMDFLCMML